MLFTFLHYNCSSTVSVFALSLKLVQRGFFPLESAHCAPVVQELNGFSLLMMVEPSFVLLSKPLDFAGHNIH